MATVGRNGEETPWWDQKAYNVARRLANEDLEHPLPGSESLVMTGVRILALWNLAH